MENHQKESDSLSRMDRPSRPSSLNAAVSSLSGGRLRVARFPPTSSGLRGLQAVCDISSGEPLMSVPADLILLPTHGHAVPSTQPKKARRMSPSSSSSMLYQLSENLCHLLMEAKSANSPMARHVRKCLFGEADAEAEAVAAITAASELVELRIRLQTLAGGISGHLGYLGRFLVGELAAPAERWLAQQLPTGVDRRLWLACCYWVNTRVVHCPVLNQPALIPYFDLFNHSPSVSVRTDYDPASRRFTLTTLTPYAAGDQVYINYGNHSNLTLLAEYDFVLLAEGATEGQHDSLPVDIVAMVSVSPEQLCSFLEELRALSLCPYPSDRMLSDPAALAKYFYLSMDGPSYYLLLLLTFEIGGLSLSNMLNSMTEDQMLEQLHDRLLALYHTVKSELLRDRNQIPLSMKNCGSEATRLVENCSTLMDIWCDIVNSLLDKVS